MLPSIKWKGSRCAVGAHRVLERMRRAVGHTSFSLDDVFRVASDVSDEFEELPVLETPREEDDLLLRWYHILTLVGEA